MPGGTGSVSGVQLGSLVAESAEHRVYESANVAWLEPVQTMPASVSRGQTGVVPLSLTLTNPGGAEASELRVRRMRVRIEDEVIANDRCADAAELTGLAGTRTGDNSFGATLEPGEEAFGQASVWYSWTPPADGTYKISTIGSPRKSRAMPNIENRKRTSR